MSDHDDIIICCLSVRIYNQISTVVRLKEYIRTELSVGWVNPRVGLCCVGSRFFIFGGLVGRGVQSMLSMTKMRHGQSRGEEKRPKQGGDFKNIT